MHGKKDPKMQTLKHDQHTNPANFIAPSILTKAPEME
jgi:hypothetical protein